MSDIIHNIVFIIVLCFIVVAVERLCNSNIDEGFQNMQYSKILASVPVRNTNLFLDDSNKAYIGGNVSSYKYIAPIMTSGSLEPDSYTGEPMPSF